LHKITVKLRVRLGRRRSLHNYSNCYIITVDNTPEESDRLTNSSTSSIVE